jgi:phosphonate transport system permease protein
MSIIATFYGGLIAFCLCFFASYQTSPHSMVVKIVRAAASLQRNIPNIIWLFILVMAFGIGLAVGMLALMLNTAGFLIRAFAEVIDEAGQESMEALDSVGAGFLPKLFQCILPEAVPGFISWLLYSLEYNIRSSSIVGACGGGGIGLVMMGYIRSFRYHIGFGIILVLAATVVGVNVLTDYLRKRVLR